MSKNYPHGRRYRIKGTDIHSMTYKRKGSRKILWSLSIYMDSYWCYNKEDQETCTLDFEGRPNIQVQFKSLEKAKKIKKLLDSPDLVIRQMGIALTKLDICIL